MLDMKEADKIKAILKERRLRYSDIAGEIGVTEQAVSDIVLGKTRKATARYAFAKALGLGVDDLWPSGVAA